MKQGARDGKSYFSKCLIRLLCEDHNHDREYDTVVNVNDLDATPATSEVSIIVSAMTEESQK